MNRKFTAYESITGKVLYFGDASDPEVLRTETTAILLDKQYSDGWIENGDHSPLPAQLSEHHIFDYALKQWVDPRTPTSEWPLVRAERDKRLLACDWTQLPDVPLATKEVWALYRQALRDITEQEDPFNIQWPSLP